MAIRSLALSDSWTSFETTIKLILGFLSTQENSCREFQCRAEINDMMFLFFITFISAIDLFAIENSVLYTKVYKSTTMKLKLNFWQTLSKVNGSYLGCLHNFKVITCQVLYVTNNTQTLEPWPLWVRTQIISYRSVQCQLPLFRQFIDRFYFYRPKLFRRLVTAGSSSFTNPHCPSIVTGFRMRLWKTGLDSLST